MSGYPTSKDDRRVQAADLDRFVRSVFEHCGMGEDDAKLLTDTLVVADLRGVHSHGVLRVPEYAAKLTSGKVNPAGRPRVASSQGAAIVVDGDNAMGQIAAAFAMDAAIEKAKQLGIAAAAVRGSNHCGAMAYYATRACRQDMIGIATTNALPTMAPWGGLDKIVGINPLAVAIPAAEELPIVFDAAFAGSSHGKIRVFHQKRLEIPEHWAFDREGRPTTDPAAAIEGLLQPIGEFKGVGLAMVMGLLSTVLSGASYGTELGNMVDGARPGQDGHFFVALDLSAFAPVDEVKARVDRAVREMRESRKRDDVAEIHSPGALESATEQHYRAEGIPLSRQTVQKLEETGRSLGIEALSIG